MDRRILQTFGTALAAGVFLAAVAVAQNNANTMGGNGKLTASDMKFAREAATGGMEEVELGHIAVQNASNDQVKQFGQRMIDDHSKANDQLKSLAAKEGFTLPTSLDAKEQAQVNALQNLKGSAFDKAYMRDMVRDHEHDIAEFQNEADSGTDPGLKTWAGQTLSTLHEHLQLAKQASSAVGAMARK